MINFDDIPKAPDGLPNWRALVKPEHLYINPNFEAELKARFNAKSKYDIDVTKVEDRQLLITLPGINYLAHLRGVKSIIPTPVLVTPTEVTIGCSVEFVPNSENPNGLIVGAIASASLHSVSGQFQLFLAAIAQNRAFVRAVRQALRIEILGKDEFDPKASQAYEQQLSAGNNPLCPPVQKESALLFEPYQLLQHRCETLKKPVSFNALKKRALDISSELNSNPGEWNDFKDINRNDCYTLLSKINAAHEN